MKSKASKSIYFCFKGKSHDKLYYNQKLIFLKRLQVFLAILPFLQKPKFGLALLLKADQRSLPDAGSLAKGCSDGSKISQNVKMHAFDLPNRDRLHNNGFQSVYASQTSLMSGLMQPFRRDI
ncbi:MAG: hypothetical protein F6K42_37205 [Leptolyngbya sp. SIO1D8]|nr:hypothetical protein [Leptolyngbya sp. SIO1D8]